MFQNFIWSHVLFSLIWDLFLNVVKRIKQVIHVVYVRHLCVPTFQILITLYGIPMRHHNIRSTRIIFKFIAYLLSHCPKICPITFLNPTFIIAFSPLWYSPTLGVLSPKLFERNFNLDLLAKYPTPSSVYLCISHSPKNDDFRVFLVSISSVS